MTSTARPTIEPQSVAEHRAAGQHALAVAVLTVSDTRTAETDTGGQLIVDSLTRAGHQVRERAIVRDDRQAIAATVQRWAANDAIDAIILTGGTGLAARDQTAEALIPLLDRRIEGFGELFRMLSYEEVGSAAMLSRAFAGVMSSTPVFALPGSRNAIDLAMTRLILPEIGHVVFEAKK